MPRAAIATPDQIRATILAMLAEAHDAAPPTRERFRRIVSVRKLKDRLGGGDPATLGRAINAVESELVAAGLSDLALPDLPTEIAELMRQLWHAAVSVQLDDIVQLKHAAAQSVEAAQTALGESHLRIDLLKQELAELRGQIAARDAELAQARADHASLANRFQALQENHAAAQDALAAARAHAAALERTHADSLAAAQQRYEGLSRQLLQETAQQRHAMQQEQGRVASQLTSAERRAAALEEALARAGMDTAVEREERLAAAGEVSVLKAVNASLKAQLDQMMQAALAPPPAPKRRASAVSGPASAGRRLAPRRKGRA